MTTQLNKQHAIYKAAMFLFDVPDATWDSAAAFVGLDRCEVKHGICELMQFSVNSEVLKEELPFPVETHITELKRNYASFCKERMKAVADQWFNLQALAV